MTLPLAAPHQYFGKQQQHLPHRSLHESVLSVASVCPAHTQACQRAHPPGAALG